MYTRDDMQINPFKKWWYTLHGSLTSRTASFAILALVTIAVPFSIYVAQQRQNLNKFASENGDAFRRACQPICDETYTWRDGEGGTYTACLRERCTSGTFATQANPQTPVLCDPKLYISAPNQQAHYNDLHVTKGATFDIHFDLGNPGYTLPADKRAVINFGPEPPLGIPNGITVNGDFIWVSREGDTGIGNYALTGLHYDNPSKSRFDFAFTIQDNVGNDWAKYQQSQANPICTNPNPKLRASQNIGVVWTTLFVDDAPGGSPVSTTTPPPAASGPCIPGGTQCTTGDTNRCEYANPNCSGGKWACTKTGNCIKSCTDSTPANCPAPTSAPPAYGAYNCNAGGRPGHCQTANNPTFGNTCQGQYDYRGTGCSAGQMCYTECTGDTPPPAAIQCGQLQLGQACQGPNALTRCQMIISNSCSYGIAQGTSGLQYYTDCTSTSPVPLSSTCAGSVPTVPPATATQPPADGGPCTPRQCANGTPYWARNSQYYRNEGCANSIGDINALNAFCTANTTVTVPPGTTVTVPPGTTVTAPPGTTVTAPPAGSPNVNTLFDFTIRLRGIGLAGVQNEGPQNDKPKTGTLDAQGNRVRPFTVELYNSLNALVGQPLTVNLTFNPTDGKWKGRLSVPMTTGTYTMKIKTNTFLKRLIGKTANRSTITITTLGQTIPLPEERLVGGDANNDNKLTVADYSEFYRPCNKKSVTDTVPAGSCKNADYNDDDILNNLTNNNDYNLFVNSFATHDGD